LDATLQRAKHALHAFDLSPHTSQFSFHLDQIGYLPNGPAQQLQDAGFQLFLVAYPGVKVHVLGRHILGRLPEVLRDPQFLEVIQECPVVFHRDTGPPLAGSSATLVAINRHIGRVPTMFLDQLRDTLFSFQRGKVFHHQSHVSHVDQLAIRFQGRIRTGGHVTTGFGIKLSVCRFS